jgi:ubiquinone/menaquinone biosynthesis C-methylase UbiE
MENLKNIYQRRFNNDIQFRNKMYAVLCRQVFQKYIPSNAVVLDVAAGYCEFINNINASKKIALDLNSDVKKYAAKNVAVIRSSATEMSQVKSNSVDVAFTSNFFEHLTRDEIIKTIREINRVLKKNGRFLILQPNIRYCYKDYWMFFDHLTPIDDRSLTEALEINGFKVIECRPRFLPFTTKSRLPKSIFLLKLYLKMTLIQKVIGQQAFIYARKK